MATIDCTNYNCYNLTDSGCRLATIDIDESGKCVQCRTDADRDSITGKFDDE